MLSSSTVCTLHRFPSFTFSPVKTVQKFLYFVGRVIIAYLVTCYGAGWSGVRIAVEARFFALVQTGRGAHPFSYKMGTGSLSWGKAAGAWG